MSEFFYRFECLDLVPGNKTSGFVLLVATEALRQLSAVKVTAEEQQQLGERMHERLARSGLIGKRAVKRCGFQLLNDSACPRYFSTDPSFGGSIGANPEELGWLIKPDALEWLGPTVDYTPHNVDTPQQALALVVMAETWGEWAYGRLHAAARQHEPAQSGQHLR